VRRGPRRCRGHRLLPAVPKHQGRERAGHGRPLGCCFAQRRLGRDVIERPRPGNPSCWCSPQSGCGPTSSTYLFLRITDSFFGLSFWRTRPRCTTRTRTYSSTERQAAGVRGRPADPRASATRAVWTDTLSLYSIARTPAILDAESIAAFRTAARAWVAALARPSTGSAHQPGF
jgi:hypothetical protein